MRGRIHSLCSERLAVPSIYSYASGVVAAAGGASQSHHMKPDLAALEAVIAQNIHLQSWLITSSSRD